METGGQRLNFGGQVVGSGDSEIWIGSGSFGDPLRMSGARMQPSHRRKRQNRGSSAQGHHTAVVQSIGLSAMTTEEILSGPIFPGVYSVNNRGSQRDLQNLSFYGFEPGSSCRARVASSGDSVALDFNGNAVSSRLQHPVIHPAGSSTNSSYADGSDQNRNTYKRKSPMDTFHGSLTQTTSPGIGENNFLTFTQGPGSQRSVAPSYSIRRESGMRGDGQPTYNLRNSAMLINRYDCPASTLMQDNFYNPSISQNERELSAFRRRFPTHDCSMDIGLSETLPHRQSIGFNAAGSWCRNSAYLEDDSNQRGFFETRNNVSRSGNYLRQSQDVEMINIASAYSRPHQRPTGAIRAAHSRDFSSQSSRLPHHQATNPSAYVGVVDMQPPPFPAAQPSSRYNSAFSQVVFPPNRSATTLSSMASGPQAVFGDLSSGSMPAQFLPRYNDTRRSLNVRQVAFRGSGLLPADGVNCPRYSASNHDVFNQPLAYEWLDTYDQHSDMRLDVDNMSYEELLALEERIGNVNTGLTEASVDVCLKKRSYAATEATPGVESQHSDPKCSVCQEEYVEGDELGELQCGHVYHTDCIKQWLILKNQCPICKAAAH